MRDDECRRPPLLERREGHLASWIYNKAHLLLARQPAPIFVPLRNVSLMAILHPQEWVFCDYIGGRLVVTSWHDFRPQERESLEEPVSCLMDLYSAEADIALKRLPMEFAQGLEHALAKTVQQTDARILPLTGSQPHDPYPS